MSINIISSRERISFSYDISLEPLCKAHLTALAKHLRLEDRRELWACYRLPVLKALEQCMARSLWSAALVYRGEVCAAAGIEPASLLGKQACVWSWTGTGLFKCRKSFLCISRDMVACFRSMYPYLYAVCDLRYKQAHHYLQYLGARRTGTAFYLAGRETQFALYQWQ